jgi:tripeptide aminopeptidase
MVSSVADLLMELVQIDSESGEEESFILHLQDLLKRRLQASCERDGFGNLIARISAHDSVHTQPILFGVHADTVSPGRGIRPVLEDGVIRSSGQTILGSDNKAGIAELITALGRAKRRPPIEILVTREEEVGLRGAKNADLSKLSARMGFVIDGADLDKIIVGGPSVIVLDVTIHGRAAHAGMRPEEGVSALQAAAMGIASLPWGRIDSVTTCNVGTLHGGTARNAIPTTAELQIECRSMEHARCVALADSIEKAFRDAAHTLGATVVVSQELAYRASRISDSSAVARAAAAALVATGIAPRIETITGGTDALILTSRGIESVVLGTGNRKSHTTDEHIAVNSLEQATLSLTALIELLASGEGEVDAAD